MSEPASTALSSAAVAEIRTSLRTWCEGAARTLPWRSDPQPWRVWVSEIMLQQTRVDTVIPYFERFMERFPTVQSLAEAPLDDVLALWSGLGYYSRARNLHRGATDVMANHGGAIPDTVEGLCSLTGIGRYTAGAIASIAFGQPAPILDGNVIRVLSRLFDLAKDVGDTSTQRTLWAWAEALVDPAHPSHFNQGMMELGALVCSPRDPACGDCPWSARCLARQRSTIAERPVKTRKTRTRHVQMVTAVVRDDAGALLLARRPEKGLFGGMWETPAGERTGSRPSPSKLLEEQMGLAVEVLGGPEHVKHVLSHRTLDIAVFVCRTTGDSPAVCPQGYTDARWLLPAELDAVGVGTLTRKVLAAAEAACPSD